MKPIELWGGHECTINRVGNEFRDQTVLSGHHRRPDDLDAFAELGLKALRYPVLWERVAADDPDVHDWTLADANLPRIRQLGMRVIAGLCHHGSGPRYTSLTEPTFAPGLARHARAAAERFPWIDMWTPVNEPLTTARFAALYGLWDPRAHDERAFWLALLNEIDATRFSMREIRAINPSAQLIQTEDLGFTHCRPALTYQAEYENERRWMSWDLLEGRVTRHHPLFERLRHLGFEDRLLAIADDPCPPDIIGVNHYLTSERFLDERTARQRP